MVNSFLFLTFALKTNFMAEYNPNKRYQWKAEDTFQINGAQFMEVLNVLRAELSTKEAQKIMMMASAEASLQEVLAKAVEAGVAVEAPEQK